MKRKIATDIDTNKWNEIVASLQKNGWIDDRKYLEIHDKRIEEGYYDLRKNKEKIVLAWTNWSEGEIKCSTSRMRKLEIEFNIQFHFGRPKVTKFTMLEKIRNSFAGK